MASQTGEIFDKISAIRSVTSMALHKIAFNEKEYDSVIDLIIDILRSFGITEQVIIKEIIGFIAGTGISQKIDTEKENLEKSVFNIVNEWDETEVSGWILGLEDAIKVTIANILTGILSCSVDPFIPKYALDGSGDMRYYGNGILIPISIVDFSGTLGVAPLGTSGQYFYDITPKSAYFEKVLRMDAKVKENEIVGYETKYRYMWVSNTENDNLTQEDAGVKTTEEELSGKLSGASEDDPNCCYVLIKNEEGEDKRKYYKKYRYESAITATVNYSGYTYKQIENESVTPEIAEESIPVSELEVYFNKEEGEAAPRYVRLERPVIPGNLYKTRDLNAFIWNSINRGQENPGTELNKMMWDSRRIDVRKNGVDTRDKPINGENGWSKWLKSKEQEGMFDTGMSQTLYPILQLQKYTGYPGDNCLRVSFPEQRYNPDGKRRTIYQFNSDYLKSINIFNPKVIIMNMIMELTKVSLFPEVKLNVSLKKQMIDAKLSTVITKLIAIDDLTVSDCYFSFSNADYNEMLKEADLRQFGAKQYNGQYGENIQYTVEDFENAANTINAGASLNTDTNTITTTIYNLSTIPGEKGQIMRSFGFDLSIHSNFIKDVIYAIIMPLVRAVFSPQVMLLFMINFEVMGLVDLSNLEEGNTFDKLMSFVMKKLVGALVTVVKQIKDAIATILYRFLQREMKQLLDDLKLTLILEELDAWLILLKQAIAIFRRTDVTILDDVNYADITKIENIPEKDAGEC